MLFLYGGVSIFTAEDQISNKKPFVPELIARNQEKVDIEKVIDGDTLIISGKQYKSEKLRLIGVDTPEVHDQYKMQRDAKRLGMTLSEVREKGLEASRFVENLITLKDPRRFFRLELDTEERDKYGRLLGYIWLADTMLNEEIIKAGYGTAMMIPPNSKYYKRFQKLEKKAKADKVGIWK